MNDKDLMKWMGVAPQVGVEQQGSADEVKVIVVNEAEQLYQSAKILATEREDVGKAVVAAAKEELPPRSAPAPELVIKNGQIYSAKAAKIRKSIADQLPFVWSPTRGFFADAIIAGKISGKGLKGALGSGWYLLAYRPWRQDYCLVRVHFRTEEQSAKYPQIFVV